MGGKNFENLASCGGSSDMGVKATVSTPSSLGAEAGVCVCWGASCVCISACTNPPDLLHSAMHWPLFLSWAPWGCREKCNKGPNLKELASSETEVKAINKHEDKSVQSPNMGDGKSNRMSRESLTVSRRGNEI